LIELMKKRLSVYKAFLSSSVEGTNLRWYVTAKVRICVFVPCPSDAFGFLEYRDIQGPKYLPKLDGGTDSFINQLQAKAETLSPLQVHIT